MKDKNSEQVAIYPVVLPETNLGDIMIHKALLHAIKARINIAVTDKYISDKTYNKLGLEEQEKAVHQGYSRGIFRKNGKMKLPDYVIMGPGHFFTTGPKLFSKHWKSRLHWIIGQTKTLIYLIMIRILGVKVCRFGVSIGPLAGIDNWFERQFAACMHFYSVRDSQSVDFVKSIGINKVKEFPDCAFLLPLQLENYGIDQNEKYIVFSFRDQIHTNHGNSEYADKILLALEEITSQLCANGDRTIYITAQVGSDLAFGKTIYEKLSPNYKVKLIEKIIEEDDLPEIYGKAEMILSNRLHVLLFGMRCLTLPVAVTYKKHHSKLTGMFIDMGIESLILDVENEISYEKELQNIAEQKENSIAQIKSEWLQRNKKANDMLSSVM